MFDCYRSRRASTNLYQCDRFLIWCVHLLFHCSLTRCFCALFLLCPVVVVQRTNHFIAHLTIHIVTHSTSTEFSTYSDQKKRRWANKEKSRGNFYFVKFVALAVSGTAECQQQCDWWMVKRWYRIGGDWGIRQNSSGRDSTFGRSTPGREV